MGSRQLSSSPLLQEWLSRLITAICHIPMIGSELRPSKFALQMRPRHKRRLPGASLLTLTIFLIHLPAISPITRYECYGEVEPPDRGTEATTERAMVEYQIVRRSTARD